MFVVVLALVIVVEAIAVLFGTVAVGIRVGKDRRWTLLAGIECFTFFIACKCVRGWRILPSLLERQTYGGILNRLTCRGIDNNIAAGVIGLCLLQKTDTGNEV